MSAMTATAIAIIFCSSTAMAFLPYFGQFSPYIGSIPSLANSQTLIETLNSSVGGYLGVKQKISNGFFWPPPPAVVANTIDRELLKGLIGGSTGLGGLGLGGLGLGGLGLGALGSGNLGLLGLLGNRLGLGLTGGLPVIRIPLLPTSTSTTPQCPASCFICSPEASSSSCFPPTVSMAALTSPPVTTQCCCCLAS